MSSWMWISRLREKEFLEKYLYHPRLILEIAKTFEKMIECLVNKNYECLYVKADEVNELERKADDVKRSMLDELAKSTIHPIDREYLVSLILEVDEIAAYIKASMKRIRTLINIEEYVGHVIEEYLINVSGKLIESIENLVKAIEELAHHPYNSLRYANIVEKIEEQVDDIKANTYQILFRECKEKDITWCILAKEIVDAAETATDKVEDSADLIRQIAVSLS
ncbi:MAG: DUF47 family protein [Desulfurococcaceae archaeon]